VYDPTRTPRADFFTLDASNSRGEDTT
jgi:hypothetical protein